MLGLAVLLGVPESLLASENPSVLVVSSKNRRAHLVDFTWLRELKGEGFEPDYLDDLDDFDWERIRHYNVLVLFSVPSSSRERSTMFRERGARPEEYVALVNRFLAEGGGVFFMAYTENADDGLRTLLEPWGARLPYEYFRETDEARLAPMPRMPSRYQLVRIDDIADSPLGAGVRNVWWPYAEHYNSSLTGPISVSDEWTVVVRGSKTSRTEPVTRKNTPRFVAPPPEPLVRHGGVRRPALLATRSYGRGRIVLLNQLPQFSVGQGTRWLYGRRVLSVGAQGIPSDWGRMVRNAFRWLAEPSLGPGPPGGYRATDARLTPPNLRPGAQERFDARFARGRRPPSPPRSLYRGLIGARSAASTGEGDVEAWARAARAAGLDFLVFAERFDRLTEGTFRELERRCRALSDSSLLLIPGYTIDTNVGNHLFVYGYDLPWPPSFVLRGSPPVLNLQARDEHGRYVKSKKTHSWLLRSHRTSGDAGHQIGVYDFDDPHAPRLHDMRDYSAAAIETWRGGALVDDQLDDYLVTAQSTMPPLPVVFVDMRRPDDLVKEVRAGRPLVYAWARSLARVPAEIGWMNQFDGPEVFVSNGPIIRSWPGMYRVFSFADAPFATDRELMKARLHVTSDVGIREIRILDGPRLVRRFLPGGERDFDVVLQLPGVVEVSLVAVVDDVRGGRAISSARRSRKEGETGIAFCGDRVNHCNAQGLLGHGPGLFAMHQVPLLSRWEAGATWDGGPRAMRPVIRFDQSIHHPRIVSDAGQEGDRAYNNLPILETANDQVVVVRSILDEVYAPGVPVVNPWLTWGPIEPSRLMRSERRFVKFDRPVVGVDPVGEPQWGLRAGAVVGSFENKITFKRDQKVRRLVLASSDATEEDMPVFLAVRKPKGGIEAHRLTGRERIPIDTGTWFGFYSSQEANASFLLNRGDPLRLESRAFRGGVKKVDLVGVLPDAAVHAGASRTYALFSVGDPLETTRTGTSRLARLAAYLDRPDGLELVRGKRLAGAGGLLELAAAGGAVDLSLPRPEEPLEATLPVCVHGLEPRWSVGMLQVEGYAPGYYGDGSDSYTTLSFDFEGKVYASLFPDRAPTTHVRIGHPIVSDAPALFIEVMPRDAERPGAKYAWHVAVDNPTDETIETTLRQGMALPGLDFQPRRIEVPAGGYRVVVP